ncbi:MAG TPA: membrane-bound PQQ-dependent dehydrogenase, glucose/quinate/shikimate family [Bauldia sp.]|nr:membrane-bound PQQ-dependent dehydrogenase, glucose/quinate/shikimate family [Bauldia sp.]
MSSNEPLLAYSRHRGVATWLTILLAGVTVFLGGIIGAGGIWLIVLGGSWYYLLAGIGLILSGALMLSGSLWGLWLYLITYVLTWVWAIWEVGFDGWALVPRVVAPTILGILLLLTMPVLRPRENRRTRDVGQSALRTASILVALVAFGGILFMRGHSTAQESAPQAAPAASAVPASGGPAPGAGADWPVYGADQHAVRYSALDQINRNNVSQLKQIWQFRTGDLPDDKTKGEYSPETTPIKIGDRLYMCSAKNMIIALDAGTGKEWWRYDPKVSDDAIPYGATCRGVAYYANPNAAPDSICAARIVEATLDARLIEVDAKDGRPCSDFGRDGSVDLTEGIGATVPGWYGHVAVPTLVRNVIVLGAQVQDGQALDAPSGVIRGFDAITGKLAWAWDMCRPDQAGAPPAGETYTRGTPNMWTAAAGDDALGYVYVPLGNASVDYWGKARQQCEDEFSSSLVALDVTTGKPVWHFQTVHHDVWDYDLGSQPTLADVGATPAVILASKQGEIYVLDRRTGKSLFLVEERKVPTNGIEEGLSPTQPFSGFHTLAKPELREKDMWGMSPIDQLACRIQFHQHVYEGQYTPPISNSRWLDFPGYNGGSDWGSVAVDPVRGILIANYNNMANSDRLMPRAEADKLGVHPINVPGPDVKQGYHEFGAQIGAPYAADINPGWRLPTGLLCTQPPWGGLTAIDLKTGKTLWDEPFGDARNNGPWGIASHLPIVIGTPNNGGAAVTAGGLIFIAATTDQMFRAIDIDSGKTLWQTKLPAGGQSTPMVFQSGGHEYVAIFAGGHHFMETPVGDYLVAYGLPAAT